MTALATACKEVDHAFRDLSGITAHDVSKLGRIVTEAELNRAKKRLPQFMQMIGLLNLKVVPANHVTVDWGRLKAICLLSGLGNPTPEFIEKMILGDKQ